MENETYQNNKAQNRYELIDMQTADKEDLTVRKKSATLAQNQAQDGPRKSLTCCLCVFSIVAVLALALALAAVPLSVINFIDNSSQQIQALEFQGQMIQALQFQLTNSSQEIQALQSQLTNSSQEIQALELQGMISSQMIQALQFQLTNSSQEIQALQFQLTNSSQEIQALQSRLTNSSQEIQVLQQETDKLKALLNQSLITTEVSFQAADDVLRNEVEDTQDSLGEVEQYILQTAAGGTSLNPASSCNDIPPFGLPGQYWVNISGSPVQVYCDANGGNCNCNTTGAWMRVAYLDMTDPSQQCPDGFRLMTRTTAPLRTCARPELPFEGCVSTTYPTHGLSYSRVCGSVIGYQFGKPEAFAPYIFETSRTIDDVYVDGVSLTHGQSPRQHIWTFANSLDEVNSRNNRRHLCPCNNPAQSFPYSLPPYVGQDYFCSTGSSGIVDFIFYPDDPLWDGQGCEGTNTCCSFNNPPFFCKQLPQPTTDDIELRLCGTLGIDDEDAPLERVEIYVQ